MSEKPATPIRCRPAEPGDARAIARFMCLAGGGLYEFLFDDLIPFVNAQDILSAGIAIDHYPVSHRNCRVATLGDGGEIVGASNVFPADELRHDDYQLLNSERHAHVRSMLALQDWGSMFLNALATDPHHRGAGIGARLLDWAKTCTAKAGFDRLSLHVWADNVAAVQFYEARGFHRIGLAEITPHPRLRHTGGSILMRWPVS